MQATAVFYGRLRDRAGTDRRAVSVPGPIDIQDFRTAVCGEDLEFAEDLAAPLIRIAINDVLLPRGEALIVHPRDEVAFMPPFSGG